MNRIKHLNVWIFAALLAVMSPLTLAHNTLSGTIVIDETQVMLLLGGSSGKGTLMMHNDGDIQRFSVSGVKLGGIGVHKLHLTGEVYNLENGKDFAGTYFAAEAGITLVEGIGGMWLKNDKGVVMHIKAGAKGVALSIGVEGFTVKLTR